MKIETNRLIIRNFSQGDAQDLYEILGDDETMEYCEPAYTLEKTEKFIDEFCIGRNGAVAAVLKETGKVIGYILFNEQEAGIYEIGWFFNKAYWRQGYAYEACKAVIDYAFGELKAHKIFAETIDNVKSGSLMKKLGMELEDIQRNQAKDNHGNRADLYLYTLRGDLEVKAAECASKSQPVSKLKAERIAGICTSSLSLICLLLLGILSSVFPAVTSVASAAPQGTEVSETVRTGLAGFLDYHSLDWLFYICLIALAAGAALIIHSLLKSRAARRIK